MLKPMLRHALLIALAGAVLAPVPSLADQALKAKPRCSNTTSNVDTNLCVEEELKTTDNQLLQAMQQVEQDARSMPGGSFPSLWDKQLNEVFNISTDPQVQFAAFRKARLNACLYMNSITMQGSGFNIFVNNCQIDMTEVLLQKLGN